MVWWFESRVSAPTSGKSQLGLEIPKRKIHLKPKFSIFHFLRFLLRLIRFFQKIQITKVGNFGVDVLIKSVYCPLLLNLSSFNIIAYL
jgi:hypothetical protein